MAKRLDLKDVNIYYGSFHAVADVTLAIPPAQRDRIHRPVRAAASRRCCGPSTGCTR